MTTEEMKSEAHKSMQRQSQVVIGKNFLFCDWCWDCVDGKPKVQRFSFWLEEKQISEKKAAQLLAANA